MKPRFAHRIKIDTPWIPAAQTDISKTFARVRKQFAAQQAEAAVRPTKRNPELPAVAAIQFRRKSA
jgi:hypothetical protein